MKAGYWGAEPNSSNSCDIPMHTLQNALELINTFAEDTDAYLFWTGDSTAHDDPWVSPAEIDETLKAIMEEVKRTFSSRNDKLFLSLGNHDSYPNG